MRLKVLNDWDIATVNRFEGAADVCGNKFLTTNDSYDRVPSPKPVGVYAEVGAAGHRRTGLPGGVETGCGSWLALKINDRRGGWKRFLNTRKS
jgi:hypothetical protein